MPLEILVLLVVGGISAIALALHLLGKSERAVLTEDSARAAWIRQFPGDTVRAVTLARDGHAALVQTPDGRGLVWSFGADTVARPLAGATLDLRPQGVRVRFDDYAAPAISLTLDPGERDRWQDLMRNS